MGCDIHVHTEIRMGMWQHYSCPDVNRNYLLFEKMAGVRGDVKNAIIPPRGVPKNPTPITEFDIARVSVAGHNHSWFGSDEVSRLAAWYETQLPTHRHLEHDFGWLFGDYWVNSKFEYRFIFWFDN